MKPTIVTSINWKESFSSYPLIILYTVDWQRPYRIAVKSFEEGTLEIIPSLYGNIDQLLEILEGCFSKKSNFLSVLQEYYSSERELKEIKFDFNELPFTMKRGMSSEDAKLLWLRNGLMAGYGNLATKLTASERTVLCKDPELKALIEGYCGEA